MNNDELPSAAPPPQQPGTPEVPYYQYGEAPSYARRPKPAPAPERLPEPTFDELAPQAALAPPKSKNKILSLVLFILFGAYGAGNFYLGQKRLGLIKIGVTLIGVILDNEVGNTLIGAMVIWGWLEAAFVLTRSNGYDRSAAGAPVT